MSSDMLNRIVFLRKHSAACNLAAIRLHAACLAGRMADAGARIRCIDRDETRINDWRKAAAAHLEDSPIQAVKWANTKGGNATAYRIFDKSTFGAHEASVVQLEELLTIIRRFEGVTDEAFGRNVAKPMKKVAVIDLGKAIRIEHKIAEVYYRAGGTTMRETEDRIRARQAIQRV